MRLFRLALALFAATLASHSLLSSMAFAELSVGAAVVDITPLELPVLVNGGMMSRSIGEIKTRVNARAIVIDNQKERIALVVVDSCMVPKELLDQAKALAAKRTKIQPNRIMVSATHTHTAPSSFGALGTAADQNYVPFLREKIAEAIAAAEGNLQPARVGWGSAEAPEFTALRRWIHRPDHITEDPFGNPTMRANMHSARDKNKVTGPSGPEDPELSMIAFESKDGKPIAVMANFSMHYFGDRNISADYFGLFSEGIANYAKSKSKTSADVVGIMSHGCSGDIWRRDYFRYNGKDESDIESYTQGLLKIAKQVYDSIEFQDSDELAMAETRLPMKYRVPDAQRLHWAKEIVATIENDLPKTREEVYAREQVYLDALQATDVVVQAIRIGDIGIATTPNETYALTGLKIKHQSPLKHTMVIELANGADGYIPPPEQHQLGGYNTWAARSAGLEVQAEPRIAATGIKLLEQVAGEPRKPWRQSTGQSADAILRMKPVAYWRLDEMEAPAATDSSGNGHDAMYEPGVVFFLPGPATNDGVFVAENEVNRCAHFAGGRLRSRMDSIDEEYTIVLSVWNGMPKDAREVTGWFFSRDHAHTTTRRGEHFGIGGTATRPGALILQMGERTITGKAQLERWKWHRVAIARGKTQINVYVDSSSADISVAAQAVSIASLFVGGRSDNDSNWEGRIDEVALFDRALDESEVATLMK